MKNRTLAVDEFIQHNQQKRRSKTLREELRDEPSPIDEGVTQADLSKMAPAQLEGRLSYYERQALFERNPHIRREFQHEVQRTRTEINRRKMYQRAEAERVFEL